MSKNKNCLSQDDSRIIGLTLAGVVGKKDEKVFASVKKLSIW